MHFLKMLIVFTVLSYLLSNCLIPKIFPNKTLITFTSSFLNVNIGKKKTKNNKTWYFSNFYLYFSIQSQALGIQLISLALYHCFSKSESTRWLI